MGAWSSTKERTQIFQAPRGTIHVSQLAETHDWDPKVKRCESNPTANRISFTFHGLVKNRRLLGFPLDILIVRIAGLIDRTTLLDLLDGIVETDLINFEPALHVQGLLLNPWVHHVVVPSFTKLKHPGLRTVSQSVS